MISWAGRVAVAAAKQVVKASRNVRLIGFDLKQAITTVGPKQFQQGTLGEDCVAGKESQGGTGAATARNNNCAQDYSC